MKKILFYPDRAFYSIPELEKRLRFKYLSQIAFETEEKRDEILSRGMEKWKNQEISNDALEMGRKFHEEIETGTLPKVSIRWINRRIGYGLFAEEKIAVGQYAGEYTGIVRENNRRYFEPINNYCYEYPVPDYIGRNFVTDATSGNLTRFINHSNRPNLKPVHVFLHGFFHLILVAIQEIRKGEQLFYEYGPSYWYIRKRPADMY